MCKTTSRHEALRLSDNIGDEDESRVEEVLDQKRKRVAEARRENFKAKKEIKLQNLPAG